MTTWFVCGEWQTGQREEKSITFTKDCQPLDADAEEMNNEVQVNFKLNLKHIHGPL